MERYGKERPEDSETTAGRGMIENFCIARRLVEAGARFVTLNFSRWDWHGGDGKIDAGRKDMPAAGSGRCCISRAICTTRGLDKDVSVVVWGEFGRTPKINKTHGRDHWPKVNCGLLAGGGMQMGQVIGESNRYAEEPHTRAGEVPGNLRYALPSDGPRCPPRPHLRRRRHAAVPSRWRHRADAGVDLIANSE